MLSSQPPYLVAQFVRQSSSDFFREWVYRDGAFERGFNLKWTLRHTATNSRKLASSGSEDEVEKLTVEADENYLQWLENTPI